MITVGELFAGIGGIGLGLEMTGGFEVKWQVERDDYAQRVLAKHWPDVPRHDDVCTFPPDYTDNWKVELICGGFPCQDISTAGKGEGLKGERSGLFYEIVRIAQRLRPRYLLLENVSALLVRGLGDVLRELAEIGYDAEWHCIPASAVGAPHRRDRIWVLAYTNSSHCERRGVSIGVQKEHTKPDSSGNCRLTREDVAYSISERQQRQRPSRNEINTKEAIIRQTVESFHGGVRPKWSIEPSVGRVAHGVPHRVDRLRGLGNAVVPQVVQFIGEQILRHERQKITQ